MLSLLLGRHGGMTRTQLRRETERSKFSDFLPYTAYGPDEQIYLNTDDSVGFLWECSPLIYASERTFKILEGLFTTGIPEKSVLQFILYADPDISHLVKSYMDNKVHCGKPILKKAIQRNAEMLQKGINGVEKALNIPVRNFRLLIALKLPPTSTLNTRQLLDLRDIVFEILKGAELQPRPVTPEKLIEMMAKLFNKEPFFDEFSDFKAEGFLESIKINNNSGSSRYRYDDTIPIRKQIISAETKIKIQWDRIFVGDKIFRCMTPKKLPTDINSLTMNILTGDIWGTQSDSNQISTPYMLTVNYIFEELKTALHKKCNFVLAQKASGSVAPSLIRKQEEYLWATGAVERGIPFVRVMPIFWHWAEDELKSAENTARAKRIWESRGFVTQEDRGILSILFKSALPFGLVNRQDNINFMERDFILDGAAAAKFMPVQADFSGMYNPISLYVGRKGQIASVNLFDKEANNHNALIAAGSGSGKSFFMNSLILDYYAAGAWFRIIDIGGSYRKICELVNGKFISFSKQSKLVLNPFSSIDDINEDQNIIAAIICQMIYSSSQERPSESKWTLIKQAIRNTYDTHGNKGQIDHVYEFLKTYNSQNDQLVKDAQELAFNLQDFISTGVYGRWFYGDSTLDISKDPFVVLELEELKGQDELFKVIILQLINYITDNLYRSDRTQAKVIVFDESWQFFGESGGQESFMMEQVIEGGYRKARKYNGSFITIFQSLLDLFNKCGGVGKVIKANSAFKFLLESEDYQLAQKEGIIEYDEFILNILKSVKSPKPRYSEIFMHTPFGIGVTRLIVDPYSYYLFTSDAKDNARIDQLINQKGLTYAEAIEEIIA